MTSSTNYNLGRDTDGAAICVVKGHAVCDIEINMKFELNELGRLRPNRILEVLAS